MQTCPRHQRSIPGVRRVKKPNNHYKALKLYSTFHPSISRHFESEINITIPILQTRLLRHIDRTVQVRSAAAAACASINDSKLAQY